MAISTGLDILAKGMSAQRTRLNLVASNLANANTTKTEEGGPYKRKDPIFKAINVDSDSPDGEGLSTVSVVEIRTDETKGQKIYDPQHPDADEKGFVEMPNVNVVEEMVNMITASRSFEANVQAFQTLRDMSNRAIDLGR
jgi:flagellar basal-body rod protein FlgC